MRQSCIDAVKKNYEYVIDAIVRDVTPKEICVVLAFCIAKNPPKPKNDPQCVLCELLVEHLEKELKDKKTIDEIEETIKHICVKLPKTVDQECEKFVKDYGDLLISIATKVPPKQICTEIQLCTAIQVNVAKKETEGTYLYKLRLYINFSLIASSLFEQLRSWNALCAMQPQRHCPILLKMKTQLTVLLWPKRHATFYQPDITKK